MSEQEATGTQSSQQQNPNTKPDDKGQQYSDSSSTEMPTTEEANAETSNTQRTETPQRQPSGETIRRGETKREKNW